ncbi:MAG: acyltransferase [Spirochaetaceae bacterium]
MKYIKSFIKKILQFVGILKISKIVVSITKTAEEDFKLVSYKGTSVDQIRSIARVAHPQTRVGELKFGKHISIRKSITLDMVGDISIGDYTIFSDHVSIFTHDHQIKTKNLILSEDEKKGVLWSSITIGSDVYFGIYTTVTKNVTNIPDGVVIGANSVLTKNPGPYEIWAGVPAKKIGERR